MRAVLIFYRLNGPKAAGGRRGMGAAEDAEAGGELHNFAREADNGRAIPSCFYNRGLAREIVF